ncbi:MAG: nitrous oxide reductase accessory protein NosL [Nitrospira sp.]|nr:nitrous oxide reductase accessory protein NosL [Nitrospira sp.]
MRRSPERHEKTKLLIIVVMMMFPLFLLSAASVEGHKQKSITKKDKCPVCGMFVYKYPKWVAVIEFADGSEYFYDGAKDMFKHYMNVPKYTPGKAGQEITSLSVTDYYAVVLIDAKEAWYVIGSDVFGPMGHELIPFETQASAQEFLEDHKGTHILRFSDVSEETIKALDEAQQ